MIRLANASDVAGIRKLMQSVPGFWDETWRDDVLERALVAVETLTSSTTKRRCSLGSPCCSSRISQHLADYLVAFDAG